ncbi:MAG: D-alanine--D-alanine ligase [Puniceicoccales bacterium]|jgi:D-alanine-D-alanine ligase|nr:D-alanine--D-alanine ligase [Puniceicoccales bacterium]
MAVVPTIVVLCGALSKERDVSLRSGEACAKALEGTFPGLVREVLEENKLPGWLDAARHVVFPVIHGAYGEDGGIQAELEAGGFAFAGSDAAASRLCIQKVEAKRKFLSASVPVAPEFVFSAEGKPRACEIISQLGTPDVVFKVANGGSSIGLHFAQNEEEIADALAAITDGEWMVEPRLKGREMTIGILGDEAMGIVEIIPLGGHYDYGNKYTPGAVRYLYPAELSETLRARIAGDALRAYGACACRDFSRLDFILSEEGQPTFLEINTMPGMTATSLFPKSAGCCGVDFQDLCERMLAPAIARFSGARLNDGHHPNS